MGKRNVSVIQHFFPFLVNGVLRSYIRCRLKDALYSGEYREGLFVCISSNHICKAANPILANCTAACILVVTMSRVLKTENRRLYSL